VLVARNKIPGITVEVTGVDRAKVMGATEIAFQRMMIGYVDRLMGWRVLVTMLAGVAPMLLVTLTISSPKNEIIRIAIILVAGLGSLAAFGFVYDAILYAKPFVILTDLPQSTWQNVWRQVAVIYRHRVTRQIFALLVALAVGILGSKLANYITFP
jgi:hypothetical protein